MLTIDGQTLQEPARAALFILEEIGYPRWLVRPFTSQPPGLGYRVGL